VRRHDQHLSSEAYANTAIAQYIYRNRASAVHRADTQGVHIRAQPFKEHGSPERAQEQELGAYAVRDSNFCDVAKHRPSRCIKIAMQERQVCEVCAKTQSCCAAQCVGQTRDNTNHLACRRVENLQVTLREFCC
jgi:hypothetical protein